MDQARSIFKALTLVLGVGSVMIGSIAHFESQWTDIYKNDEEAKKRYKDFAEREGKPFPSLSMELYFVSITIIAVILSTGILIALLVRKEPILEKVDAAIHLVVGALLFIGAIVFIVSANQIWSLAKEIDGLDSKNTIQLYDKKIIAGVLSIINAGIYLAISILTALAIRKEMEIAKKVLSYGLPITTAKVPPLN